LEVAAEEPGLRPVEAEAAMKIKIVGVGNRLKAVIRR